MGPFGPVDLYNHFHLSPLLQPWVSQHRLLETPMMSQMCFPVSIHFASWRDKDRFCFTVQTCLVNTKKHEDCCSGTDVLSGSDPNPLSSSRDVRGSLKIFLSSTVTQLLKDYSEDTPGIFPCKWRTVAVFS